MGTNPILTKITIIFKLPTGSRGATPQVLKADKRKKILLTPSMRLKSWLCPNRSFWSRGYKYTSPEKTLSPVLDLTERPHFWHGAPYSPPSHLLSYQWPVTTRATTLWVFWGSDNTWKVLCAPGPQKHKINKLCTSSRGSAWLHCCTWFGWTCRRVYSLKKWDAVQLDFLHCLVLVLCEEEEGHLEAMRSL